MECVPHPLATMPVLLSVAATRQHWQLRGDVSSSVIEGGAGWLLGLPQQHG